MICPYLPDDLTKVLQLLRSNTPKYFASEEEADLIDYLATDADNYFVIKKEGNLLGCGGFNWFDNKGIARISWDIIHPDHQGEGLGKTLVEFRIGKIKATAPTCKIIVRTSQHAFKFYEKNGFSLQKIEKDYWADGFDLYLMELN
ncbi:MAG: GNAT family N-acetyltransferase [Saprospiraceae bacterium]